MTLPDDSRPKSQAPGRRYLLVTPCRDEARYARRTIESMARQSVPPALWIIVDDGSTDATPAILAEYAAKLPYLRVIRLDDRGFRKLGGAFPGVEVVAVPSTSPRNNGLRAERLEAFRRLKALVEALPPRGM